MSLARLSWPLVGLGPILAALPSATAPEPASDPRVAWLAEHAVRLRSIDPADRDFRDLEPLRAALDGVRVVILGEQSHGDGTAFLAKARLIAFLHQGMGFDVLAFESGFYDCARAWQDIQAGGDPAAAVRGAVFSIWTLSEQVRPTIDYLAAAAGSPRPLELAGFDSQFTGELAREHFVEDLTAYLRELGVPGLDEPAWRELAEHLDGLAGSRYLKGEASAPEPAAQEAFRARIEELRREVAERAPPGDRQAAFWRQMLANVASFSRTSWEIDPERPVADPALFELRDLQMGENLVWLARERYPGRRIIAWAHTFHGARNLGRLGDGAPAFWRSIRVMGDVVHRELGPEAYTLGFLAHEGEMGTVFGDPESMPVPAAGSLEDLAHRAGLEHAYLDLRRPPPGGEWLRETLTAGGVGYLSVTGDWSEVVDGFVYSREMVPSRRMVRSQPLKPSR